MRFSARPRIAGPRNPVVLRRSLWHFVGVFNRGARTPLLAVDLTGLSAGPCGATELSGRSGSADDEAVRPAEKRSGDERAEHLVARFRVETPQASCLFRRQTQAGHLVEFAAHAIDDVLKFHGQPFFELLLNRGKEKGLKTPGNSVPAPNSGVARPAAYTAARTIRIRARLRPGSGYSPIMRIQA